MCVVFDRFAGRARLVPFGAEIGHQVAIQAQGGRVRNIRRICPLYGTLSFSPPHGKTLVSDFHYPSPPRPTIEALDPENATTDTLIARVRRHRQDEEYPTPETLLSHLPVVLRALCDHLLSGEAIALGVCRTWC